MFNISYSCCIMILAVFSAINWYLSFYLSGLGTDFAWLSTLPCLLPVSQQWPRLGFERDGKTRNASFWIQMLLPGERLRLTDFLETNCSLRNEELVENSDRPHSRICVRDMVWLWFGVSVIDRNGCGTYAEGYHHCHVAGMRYTQRINGQWVDWCRGGRLVEQTSGSALLIRSVAQNTGLLAISDITPSSDLILSLISSVW